MNCCHKKELLKKAADTVRLLCADAVQKAGSGHPGMPMGTADYAFTLWNEYLRFNPDDPNWMGRDRFVLSAGHGSTLLYSLLHLFGGDVTMDDLKTFRQLGSKCPGHPEYGHTKGVEVTTGPLASGLATAVGMAIGLKHFQERTGVCKCLFNQRVYVISGDGCIMEGTSHEACALAGHLGLDNLVLFYDDNGITIEGHTDLAFSENVGARFEAYGWNVLRINGQDIRQIRGALDFARVGNGKPTIIIGKTTIGYGAPNLAGTPDCHGAPLGPDELAATKEALGFDPAESFVVPDEVRALCEESIAAKREQAKKWDECFAKFRAEKWDAEKQAVFESLVNPQIPDDLEQELLAVQSSKDVASRASSGTTMQRVAALLPFFIGGSADLAPSNKTYLKGFGDFSAADRTGRNFHFGIRELGMGLICNGLALTGFLPFSATFMVFSDYMKPAIRLAAIMKLHEIYVFTHDSFFVGEDGPTHEPVEQLAMLRTIPGVTVIRPAEAHETALAWAAAVRAKGPVVLSLTRQNLRNLPPEIVAKMDVSRGAYVVSEDEGFEAVLIGSGSELQTVVDAAEILRAKGRKVRVVSMPSQELFLAQDEAYRESVLPAACKKRVSVEAGSTFGWERFTGSDGLAIGLDHFGDSAPYKVLAEKYGFTGAALAEKIDAYLG